MKNTKTRISLVVLCLVMVFAFAACNDVDATGIWEDATYLSAKEFGDGATTITLEVKAGEQSLTFTIKTDKETLDEALLEHELIVGEMGAYGWYVTKVNGMTASTADNAYWALYIDGEYALTGVSSTPVTEGGAYTFAYETF